MPAISGTLGRLLGIGCCVMLVATGCAFNGLNSLPLPGAVGRGPGASIYRIELANVGTLEANSPVMIDDVIVGSISKMTVQNWHAFVEVSVNSDVTVPANAVASVGQTSLLGSMHLQLNPPPGQEGSGKLQPCQRPIDRCVSIKLDRSSTYPSTEQTLSSLSVVLNAGGLSQFGDVIHNFNAALGGRGGDIRDLLNRLDRFVGTFDQQRDNIVASLRALNRLSATFANQRDVITQALNKIPPALDVLIKERPRLVAALNKLGVFSDTATRLVNDAGNDLVGNLRNLGPALGALADIGPDLDAAIAYAPTFPFTQGFIDRYIRGDYVNGTFIIDLTNAGLRKSILLGTHWGRLGAEGVPGPGDPEYLLFKYGAPPPPPAGAPLLQQTLPGPLPAGSAGSAGSAGVAGVAGAAELPGPPPSGVPGSPGPGNFATPGTGGPESGAPVPGATPATSQPTDGGQ
jgi:phospholipid/cholesterol/gamma-HCH transport system substrate-binding protein